MIYEYAVDPSIFISEDKACFIIESFGRDKGRLVSEIRKDHWLNLVRDSIRKSDNKPIARHILKEALKILVKNQKALYCRQQQIEAPDWLKLTQKAHSVWPYRGILVEQYDGDNNYFLVRDIYLSRNPNWEVPPSITVDREAAAMVAAVSPMLENAREVMLVDKNFRLENQSGSFIGKYKNVLIRFLEFLANKKYGPPVNKLTYHLGKNGITEITDSVIRHLEYQCDRHLKNDIPSGIKLEIAIWPWDELHDRFLLTDIGSVDFGHGLDEWSGSGKKEVKIGRLSNENYKELWSMCKQKRPDFTIP